MRGSALFDEFDPVDMPVSTQVTILVTYPGVAVVWLCLTSLPSNVVLPCRTSTILDHSPLTNVKTALRDILP